MTLKEIETLAIKLMSKHGLIDAGWKFSFDNAKRKFGCCKHSKKTISMSAPLNKIREAKNVKNTILHEIAHALVGFGHGHDHVWKSKAIEIGCNGERCSGDVTLKGNWVGECPNGHKVYRHRIPKRKTSCGVCYPNFYNEKYLIKFKKEKHEQNAVLS